MKMPPLLIGAVTIYWGLCSGWFEVSVIAAVIFESSVFIKTRFDLKDSDFIKISDLSSIVMLILLFYSYLENEPRRIFLYFLSTMPIVFMPLMFAQIYSTRDTVVIGTSFGKGVHRHDPLDVRWLYLISVFIAAGSADNRAMWFFPVTLVLILWALYGSVSTRYKLIKFTAFSVFAFFLSFSFTAGIEIAHIGLREKMMELYRNWYQSLSEDPYKTSTAMGDTGYLKLSGKIIMRIFPHTGTGIPIYLKTADYNVLSGSTWHVRSEAKEPVFPDGEMAWQIFEEGPLSGSMTVSKWMGRDGQGLLALPEGSRRTENMDVAGIEKSGLAAVKIEEGPDLLDYTVFYDEEFRYEPPPEQRDIMIPEVERKVIEKIVTENELKGENDLDSVMRVEKFFAPFTYSLQLSNDSRNISILEDFLLSTRSGHCEYYASATVLILRAIGIPARYSTGYSVTEYSGLEKSLIARERDAHAWVTAFVEGKWTVIDTTPSIWHEADRSRRSFFEPVKDLFSWLRIEYERFRRTKNEEFNRFLIAVATILTVFMMLRIYLRQKKVNKNRSKKKIVLDIQGIDSPFYKLMEKYEKYGFGKLDNESIRQWKKRVEALLDEKEREEFGIMTGFHERLRFDVDSDKKNLFERLEKLCGEWIKNIRTAPGRKKRE